MKCVFVVLVICLLGCGHEHPEYILTDQDLDLIEHTHDYASIGHEHDLTEHNHDYASISHKHESTLIEHTHPAVRSRLNRLELNRDHTHTDLHSRINTHDHEVPQLTFDTCPIPHLNTDWKGRSAFFYFPDDSGNVLLSNGEYGALAISSYGRRGDYDYVVGGPVINSIRISVSHRGTDSGNERGEPIPDGKLTDAEVTKYDTNNSWVGLDRNHEILLYNLASQGDVSGASALITCVPEEEKEAPELALKLTNLAKDLIDIMERSE